MNDVDIVTEHFHFKYRVCGIIIVNNKLLVVDMQNNGFYCLPGGHVHVGENSNEAITREIKEEVGCDVTINKLIGIHENFFPRKGREYHELGFYYLLNPDLNSLNLNDYTFMENDCGVNKELKFKWIDLKKIDTIDFRPSFIKNKLINNDYEFIHTITNE